MTSQKSKNKTANAGGYNNNNPTTKTEDAKVLDHLKGQHEKKASRKEDEIGYVGGRVSMKQMKLYLTYAQPGTGQVRAIKSLCGAYQHKKKKAA